jgi:hypothetical protein
MLVSSILSDSPKTLALLSELCRRRNRTRAPRSDRSESSARPERTGPSSPPFRE